MNAITWCAAFSPLLLAFTACTSTGFGVGELSGAGVARQQVNFNWSSTNGGLSGELTAALAQSTYRGTFFQITQQTRSEVMQPYWPPVYSQPYHYHPHLYPYPHQLIYPYPYSYPTSRLTTFYTGTVLATLAAQNGQTMRCRFQLVDPAQGMSAGGQGQCELTDGRLVRAVLAGYQR